MAQYNTTTQLDGNFKEVYGENLENLVPEAAKIVKMVPFSQRNKIGDSFHQPVIVSQEHGVTYAAAGDGAFSLSNSVAMQVQDAQVNGSQMLLRSAIDYETLSKASGDKKAFMAATELVVRTMMESLTKRLEIGCLYGAATTGLGEVPQSGYTNQSSTSTRLEFAAGQWAPGIWAGAENAILQAYNSGSLVSSGDDSLFTISSVDNDNRYLTVTGTSTGITALETQLDSTAVQLFYRTSKTKEMNGIDKIITNTGSLFNINASTYNLWQGNSYAVGGQLTQAKIGEAISKAVGRGGLDEDAVLLVNPFTWADLNSDAAAKRVYNDNISQRGEDGFEKLVYHAQNGKVEVVSHNIVKASEAYLLAKSRWMRIGSTDITFEPPGREKGRVFFELESVAAYELRAYTNQSIFCEAPAKNVKLTGITNTGS